MENVAHGVAVGVDEARHKSETDVFEVIHQPEIAALGVGEDDFDELPSRRGLSRLTDLLKNFFLGRIIVEA